MAKASKAKQIVDAQAAAEQKKLEANAEAAAIYAKLEARARGEYEILAKKGEGLRQIVEGAAARGRLQLLLLEHLEKLSETAASAISNIKFDKIVVWDGGNAKGGTANFLQSLTHALPPMLNIMKDVGGIEMPEFFGKVMSDPGTKEPKVSEPKP